MSRASKWLRTFFAGKKSDSDSDSHPYKKKWPFPFMFKSRGRKLKEKHPSQSAAHKPQQSINNENIELQGKSREAVPVRVTGRRKYSTTCDGPRGGTAVVGYTYRRDKDLRWAVVTIQSHFRGYLSRRALCALKALVKLQALVRGHILRKQMGNVMRQMEALARAQTRARLGRVLNSQVQRHSSPKSTGPMTPQRIIEVDTWRTESTPRRRRRMFHSSDLSYCPSFSTSKDSTARQTNLSGEVQSFRHLKHGGDDSTFYTPDSSPKVYSSASSGRGGAFTPDKSESYRSRLTGSANHPNYMSYTESSKAKVRSFSAPKQRPNYEPVHAYADTRPYVYKASALHAIFSHKAYPGSGRLDRLGEP